jgi:glutamate decarboxylase
MKFLISLISFVTIVFSITASQMSSVYNLSHDNVLPVNTLSSFPKKILPSETVYQTIKKELSLNGKPTLNLATFVNTEMEPNANKLINENLPYNYIDLSEYRVFPEINERCVKMIADLFNLKNPEKAYGTSTIGSSEAIMLALLAAKKRWQIERKKNGLSIEHPNIVFTADVHTCWDKFANYFDVEPRIIPIDDKEFIMDVKEVGKLIDENTIAAGVVMGTTFTGGNDNVKKLNDYLLNFKKIKHIDIPIHVDAASGGFVYPFTSPDLLWDFRLEQVKSINVSGHKFGLVYPGIGWVVFRSKNMVPDELIYKINYLGGEMENFSINFSRSASNLVAQYYNFLRFGREGYTKIMKNTITNSSYLGKELQKIRNFEIINDGTIFPMVCFRLKDETKYTVFELSDKLRQQGWIVPAYTLPSKAENIAVMRIVVRPIINRTLIDALCTAISSVVKSLENQKITHS